ncbi:MAG: response regulator transcription factor [Actinomycetales bacterium]|nr:response regulator transcription factor [Actinomycetales bacterium]
MSATGALPPAAEPTAPTTVLVVDDHALFRDGLIALISRWADFEVIGTAADGAEAVRLAAALHPGLVLMDVRMDGMGGVEATRLITEADPAITVAMLTMSNLGEDVYQALRNGAHGYLSKDEPADRLHDYLAGLMRGEAAMSSAIAARVLAEFGAQGGSARPVPPAHERLTHRERDVLRLLVEGMSNEEIARDLFLSEATVKKHLGSIMTKLHVRNRVQAAVLGLRQGIVG